MMMVKSAEWIRDNQHLINKGAQPATMIEAVGRAINPDAWATQDGLKEHSPDYWASPTETETRATLTVRARAAIEAMREPTPEMMGGANKAQPFLDGEWDFGRKIIEDIWQAMIDAALKD